jgi:hypothetical protein
MRLDINLSVVDAVRGGKLHPQGSDGAGRIPNKFNLVIQPAAFIDIGARYPAAGCQ